MHLLTSFSRCFSSLGVLLLSSMSLRISASLIDKSSLTFASADAVARASFIIVIFDFAHVAAGMEHDRTCLFTLMWKSCTKVFFSIVIRMFFILRALFRQSLPCQHVAAAAAATSTTSAGCMRPIRLDACAQSELIRPVVLSSYCCSSCFFFRFLVFLLHLFFFDRVWALFRQSLPCHLVVFSAFTYVVAHTGCRRPPVLTSMLTQSWNTPLVCHCAAALHASSFNLLCFCFLKCAICFCCCSVFSFDLCFCVLPCVMCFISFCGGVFLLFRRFLDIFSSSGISLLMFFLQFVYSFHV